MIWFLRAASSSVARCASSGRRTEIDQGVVDIEEHRTQ